MDSKKMSRKLLGTTVLYFVANFSTRALSFFLLPLYTSYLTPADYGSVDMVFTVAQFLTPVITLNLTNAAFRYLIEAEDHKQKSGVISSSFFTITFGFVVLLVVSVIAAAWTQNVLVMFCGFYIVATSLSSYLMQTYRGLKKNKTYAVMGVVHSALQILLNVLFVVGLQIKSWSLLLSPIISSIATAVFLLCNNGFCKYICLSEFNKVTLKSLLRFSLPTVPETLIWWFLTGFAKMFLSAVHGEASLGIYAVANKFSDLLIMLYSIFNLAWSEFAYIAYKEKNRDSIYSIAFNNISRVMLSAVLVLLPLTRIGISLFLNESYLSGMMYMPVLYLMAYINILSTYYGSGFQSAKKTNGILYSSLLGVMVNVPLCLILIPCLDVWGAIISLFAANIMLLVSKKIMSRKFFLISIDYKNFLLLIPIGLCVVAFYLASNLVNVFFFIGAAIVALYSNRQLINTVLSSLRRRDRNE